MHVGFVMFGVALYTFTDMLQTCFFVSMSVDIYAHAHIGRVRAVYVFPHASVAIVALQEPSAYAS